MSTVPFRIKLHAKKAFWDVLMLKYTELLALDLSLKFTLKEIYSLCFIHSTLIWYHFVATIQCACLYSMHTLLLVLKLFYIDEYRFINVNVCKKVGTKHKCFILLKIKGPSKVIALYMSRCCIVTLPKGVNLYLKIPSTPISPDFHREILS